MPLNKETELTKLCSIQILYLKIELDIYDEFSYLRTAIYSCFLLDIFQM